MADGDYRILLGVDLNESDFSNIKNKINDLEKNNKINIRFDFGDADKQIQNIKKALQDINNPKNNKSLLSFDTSKLESSFRDIKSIVADIKSVLGSLDSGTNMKPLLSSVNQISAALDKASGKFDELNASLNALSGKDLNLSFGINLGSSNSVARNTIYGSKVRNETLPQLKQQMSDLVKYYNTTYKQSLNEFEVLQKMVSGTKLSNGDFFENFLFGKDSVASRMSGGSLSSQMQAYKQYIDMFKQAASLKGLDLSSVTSSFSKSADDLIKDAQDIQTGAKEMEDSFEKLKQVFGGGSNLNVEGLSAQLEPIVTDLNKIREVVESLSSNVSIDGLTQSFDRLSETLEQLMTNAKLVQDVLGNGISNASNNIIQTTQQINQAKKLISDTTQEAIDNVSSERIGKYFRIDSSDSKAFEQEMNNLVSQWTDGKGNSVKVLDIKTKTSWDKEAEARVKRLHQAQIQYNNELGVTEKKTIAWTRIGTTTDSKGKEKALYGFAEVADQYSKSLGKTKAQTDAFVKQQKKAVTDLTNQINQLNRAASDQNAARPIKLDSHLTSLADKYNEITAAIQRMESASSDTFVDEQNNVKKLISEFKSLVSEYKNAENVSTKMKGTDLQSGVNIALNDLKKFKADAKDYPQLVSTINKLKESLNEVGDASSLNKFNDQLRVARSELAKVKSETTAANRSEKVGINVSGLESKITDLQRISPEVDKFEAEIDGAKVSVQSLLSDLKQVNTQSDFSVVNSKWKAFTDAAKAAGIAVTETVTKARTALANDIKLDIELGNFDNEMDGMLGKFNSLSDANTELRSSVDAVKNAYKKLQDAADANTGDEVADRERLIQAEKEYAAALEKTNNLIKIQAREDKAKNNALKLEDDRQLFQSKIDSWLTQNSAATKKFGAAMLDLKAKAENCDRVELNHLEREFKKLDIAADKAGLKMQSFGDRIKTKLKEYSAYFSVAEVFMYTEQALRSMFEQVKLIDSAMTELKKVTDESDASYNQFLTNAATRAKEIGTTIDGLVSSTADFARLGYDFVNAQGLAEVANIYAVVGDEINDVEDATQSLISTLTAFKNEMGDMDDSEFALSIVDKMNEVSNNFAISSGGIGEALQRSASSMMAANNTLDETIALITAANTVVQDPTMVGTAFKTISMRIRGAKTELEEAGLETEGMVESTAKLREEILALSGVDIMIND